MEKTNGKTTIDVKTVAKVAELSRLKLTDSEIAAISGQLSAVLENFEQLATVDTKGVAPMVTATDLKIQLREDKAEKVSSIEPFLANAPARAGNLYKVPPVV